MPLRHLSGRRMGLAVVEMERYHHQRERLCLWQVLQRQGGIHQPLVVDAFLQLAPQPLSHAGECSIEGIIYQTLCEQGSIINRDLRAACGFSGAKMRSKFDGYVTRLQMATRVVTEDFVYPRDKHSREYGWGWSLLATPERLYGKDACAIDCPPEESYRLMNDHLHAIIPHASDKQISKLLR